MHPLRSEADAFKILLIVGAGALAVIVVALLIGSLPGFLVGLFLIGIGIGGLVRGRAAPPSTGDVAVIIDDVPTDEFVAGLGKIEGTPEFLLAMVVAPNSPSADRERARQRMEVTVQLLQEAGLRARGRVLEARPEDLRGDGPVPGVEADQVIVSLRGT